MTNKAKNAVFESFGPLVIDAGVPVAMYYVLSGPGGMSTLAALAWSSALPLVRTLWSLARGRVNLLAVAILLVNVTGLALSLVVGDPRLMLAKDSAVTSVLGLAVLVSVALGRPLMTAGLKPWVTKGDPARVERWERLSGSSASFRNAERAFSRIWGAALLVECAVRLVGVCLLPVETMVWLGPVILGVSLTLATLVAGGRAAVPMERMVAAK
ncbi:hypothetical protein GCM10027445_13960 [Amycolatopsis endophytica]|uniref:DUF3159 domain-containing protein n=1 Tax=Amycolatopsis endophytica TaxID=860233 RepID=A0A853B454_9PSEU|nr:VC0807 family protein [Amycolatopsis endophytica]NYI89531.1 hypothetical protein [Amycolatopsis endophytica]